jgi:DNA mismatch repair protein MutL
LVRNLFYNVPSRRKFIDGDNTRLTSQIKQEFQRVALCNPDVEFELRQNDVPIYMLQPTNRRGRIIDIVGKHIKNNLLDVDVDTSVVRIEGFVGCPAAAKKRNNEQYLFVNGRYFYSQAMQRTIVRTYEKLIPEGCAPSYFIYITVDPERVDVNVHPQKTTVKFADMDLILEMLQAAIRETLAKTGAVPMMDFSAAGAVDLPVFEQQRQVCREPRVATNVSYNPFSDEYIDPTAPMPDVPFTGFDVPYDGAMPKSTSHVEPRVEESAEYYTMHSSSNGGSVVEFIDEIEGEESLFDIVSSEATKPQPTFGECVVLPGGFVVSTYGGRGVVVMPCRAKERMLYEDLLKSITCGSAPSQRMFFAEELVLGNEEYALMEEHATEFAALGFEVEYRGEGRISVIGRPALIDVATPLDELIYDLLHGIDDGTMPVERERERLAELMARRGSAGYGRGITSAEAVELLRRLEKCDNPSFSPSGAPIMAELTTEELRAKLSRN